MESQCDPRAVDANVLVGSFLIEVAISMPMHPWGCSCRCCCCCRWLKQGTANGCQGDLAGEQTAHQKDLKAVRWPDARISTLIAISGQHQSLARMCSATMSSCAEPQSEATLPWARSSASPASATGRWTTAEKPHIRLENDWEPVMGPFVLSVKADYRFPQCGTMFELWDINTQKHILKKILFLVAGYSFLVIL